jgi:gliding motility-associated-like protein
MFLKSFFSTFLFTIISAIAFGQNNIAPIEYVRNDGQWLHSFNYKAITTRGDFYISKKGFMVVLSEMENHEKLSKRHHGQISGEVVLNYHAYEMQFVNANKNVTLSDAKPQKHYYNYFLGNNPNHWKSFIHPAYNVDYKNLYNNIDAHIYSENGNIKYDFIVHPGGNIHDLKIAYTGAEKLSIKKRCLEIQTSIGENTEMPPYAYQYINSEKVEIKCDYVLQNNEIHYALGDNYDPTQELIIDPTLVFCTFTGSTADNWGYSATFDSLGNFYAGGIVGNSAPNNGLPAGLSYPVTPGAFQMTYGGGGPSGQGNAFRYDASVSKFDALGVNLLYATYLGGNDNDQGQSLIVDHSGNLVIAGRTYSANFPIKPNGYDTSYNGNGDLFVTKLNWTGSALVGSTFVGGALEDAVNTFADELTLGGLKHNYGDDARSEVIVDSSNNVYVAAASFSTDFPTKFPSQTANAGSQDGILVELNNDCSALLWSTYIGGSGNDAAYVLSFNKQNEKQLFVAGGTMSSNFPTTPGTIHPTVIGGTIDGFLHKYNTVAHTLVKGTYIGTNAYDQVYGVQTDDSNRVYIMGQTMGAYPVVGTVYNNAGSSQFISRIDTNFAAYSLSTVFGSGSTSSTNISPNAFLVDICGNVYVSGWGGPITPNNPGTTNGMPVTANAYKGTTDGSDFYFIVLSKNLGSLLYGSFFGQIGGFGGEHVDGGTSRFDPNGVIYQAVCANCGAVSTTNPKPIFPTSPGVYSTTNPSPNCNLGAIKLDFQLIGANAVADATPNAIGCLPFTINFTNGSTNATNYLWDFGDGTATSTLTTPTHTYTTTGTFTAKLVAYNPNGCKGLTDTAKLTIIVQNDTIKNSFVITKLDSCATFKIGVTNSSTYYNGTFGVSTQWLWNWGDGSTSNVQNPAPHIYAATGVYNVSLTITDTNACNNPVKVTKQVSFINNVISTNFALQDTACTQFTHTFSSTSLGAQTYNWNFGDGTPNSNATNPTHTFAAYGTYTITLIIGNPTSCNKLDSFKQVLHIKPDITAAFTFVKKDTCNPYNILVNNSSTLTPYTNSNAWTKFTWNWGDGNTQISANPINHNYPTPGTYTITMVMIDSTSCNSPQTTTKIVTFIDNRVKSELTLPDTACVPFTWTYNNLSTNVTTYSWIFSDGFTSNAIAPTHTFNTVGNFWVKQFTFNPLACNLVDSVYQSINIQPSPIADFVYAPNPLQANKSVTFTNKSQGATSYSWDFGDGTSSVETNPTHLYNKTAETKVCLTAYNGYGCPHTKCLPISPRVINIIDVPTGFSPNGDGINDYIQVRGYGVKEYSFKIFNRWGEMVFQSTNINDKWDGSYKGKIQDIDAFSYLLQVTFTDNSLSVKKGNITLLQ